MFDQAWGMPLENWGPTSSFNVPILPPLQAPDEGVLVQLPCVNRDWLPVILGACDQLRDPATWDPSIGDSALALVLDRANLLREMMNVVNVPCCNVTMRMTADCHLQFSVDGGTTWTTVTGWDANFDSCVKAHIPPQVPANPGGTLPNQHACNLAGFLSTKIIQATMVAMESYVGTVNEQVAFAHSVINAIGFAFPITNAFANAAYGFYQEVVGQLLSEVTAAGSDATLWADVTCAIYNAIRSVGYVDATNFAAVQANLHAISYPHAWVPLAIGNYWGELGLGNIQAWQAIGALDDVDCTGCGGPWCHEFDFRLSMQGYSAVAGLSPVWVSGVGWEGAYESGPDVTRLWISGGAWPAPGVVTRISLFASSPFAGSAININHQNHLTCFNGATDVDDIILPNPYGGLSRLDLVVPSITMNEVSIYFIEEGNKPVPVIEYLIVAGTGVSPFPTLDCAD